MVHVNAHSRHHGIEIQKGTTEKDEILQRIKNLKASLRTAYKELATVNRKAHRNKKFYDRKAKERHFATNDLVYLFTPATKPGTTKKFRKYWSGPYMVLRKMSELNYEIVSNDNKKQIVHVNRLKYAITKVSGIPREVRKSRRRSEKRKRNAATRAKARKKNLE